MTQLRVAIISLHEDKLHAHLFSDLGQLKAAVSILVANHNRRFAIDVGFDEFDDLEAQKLLFEGHHQVLISEQASAILRNFVQVDSPPAVTVNGAAFHVALTLWGQSCGQVRPSRRGREPQGWVAELIKRDRMISSHLAQVEIWSEESYKSNEHQLSGTLRIALARSRFVLLAGEPPSPTNILDRIAYCPAWVTQQRFDTLPLNVRQANVLRAYNLHSINDLARVGTNGLLKLPNMGSKSVRELGKTIYDVFTTAPEQNWNQEEQGLFEASEEIDDAIPLLHATCRWVDAQDQTARIVLRGRLGLERERATLQELADSLGLTRERIRQIESKALTRMKGISLWPTMAARIENLLKHRTTPLQIAELHLEDPWFGASNDTNVLVATAVRNFLAGRLNVLIVNGKEVVSEISVAAWDRTIADAKLILGEVPSDGDDMRLDKLVTYLLANEGEELRGVLKDALQANSIADVSRLPDELGPPPTEDDLLARNLRHEMLRRQLSGVA